MLAQAGARAALPAPLLPREPGRGCSILSTRLKPHLGTCGAGPRTGLPGKRKSASGSSEVAAAASVPCLLQLGGFALHPHAQQRPLCLLDQGSGKAFAPFPRSCSIPRGCPSQRRFGECGDAFPCRKAQSLLCVPLTRSNCINWVHSKEARALRGGTRRLYRGCLILQAAIHPFIDSSSAVSQPSPFPLAVHGGFIPHSPFTHAHNHCWGRSGARGGEGSPQEGVRGCIQPQRGLKRKQEFSPWLGMGQKDHLLYGVKCICSAGARCRSLCPTRDPSSQHPFALLRSLHPNGTCCDNPSSHGEPPSKQLHLG